ncbi:hypothetical protein D3C76_560330 [compost metagenome]
MRPRRAACRMASGRCPGSQDARPQSRGSRARLAAQGRAQQSVAFLAAQPLPAALAADRRILGRRVAGWAGGAGVRPSRRPGQRDLPQRGGAQPMVAVAGLPARFCLAGLVDPGCAEEHPRQRHPAGDRGAGTEQQPYAQCAAVAADRGRQTGPDPAGAAGWRLRRTRRPDGAYRRGTDVFLRPPPGPVRKTHRHRADSRRRRGGHSCGFQYAAGWRGVRHRGAEQDLRAALQRPAAHCRAAWRHGYTGADGQLQLLRQTLGKHAAGAGLDGGGGLRCARWPARRDLLPSDPAGEEWPAELHLPMARSLANSLRIRLRIASGAAGVVLGAACVRHRLCGNPLDPRRPAHRRSLVPAVEVPRQRGVVHRRHSGRIVLAIVDRWRQPGAVDHAADSGRDSAGGRVARHVRLSRRGHPHAADGHGDHHRAVAQP